MEYYLSDYILDGEGRRIPRVVDGSFTSINIQDKAIVALQNRADGPGRIHLCSCAKEPAKTPSRLLGQAFKCSLIGDTLGVVLAELLLKHIPPGLRPYSPPVARTAIHGPEGEIKYIRQVREGHGEKYQIWLGNECVWEMPCLRGGVVRSDDFNRPDEVPLTTGVGPNDPWDVASGRELPELRRTDPTDNSTGQIKAVYGVSPDAYRHRAAKWNDVNTPFESNHSAQIGAVLLCSTVGPTLRHQAGADTFYYIYYFENNPVSASQDLYISKFIAGVETTLGSQVGITSNAFNTSNATIRGEASGSTIKALFQGTGYSELTLLITVTDTAITGGVPGFDVSSRSSGIVGGPLHGFADNFQCDGDVEGAQFGQPINC